MMDRRVFIGGSAAMLISACSSSGGGGGGGSPSSKFRLNKWRIQLPVNDSGGFSGDMEIINPARTVKPWFIASADRLEFTCPAKGATSPGTSNPRTELAENDAWRMERGGVMVASLVVNAIPSGGVTVGQVWNRDQALRLSVLADGRVRTGSEYVPGLTVGKVVIGQPFSYRVEVANSALKLFLNDALVQQYGINQWAGQQMYFKAGAYCGAAVGTDPKALFKVTFTDLVISH